MGTVNTRASRQKTSPLVDNSFFSIVSASSTSYIRHPSCVGLRTLTMLRAERVQFPSGVVCCQGYDDDENKWVQVRPSNLHSTDDEGTHDALAYAKANEGKRVSDGSGARSQKEGN